MSERSTSNNILTLERRREHLQRRLDDRGNDYRSGASSDYDRAEIAALTAAIGAMRIAHAGPTALHVFIYRGSGSDLATDIKAAVPPDEIQRLVVGLESRRG